MDISVIVPLYNEKESVRELFEEIRTSMRDEEFDYEIIMVDDGSTDQSFDEVRSLALENREVKGLRFRTNYGKSAALSEGFRRAKGRYVVTMDGDLQDDPSEIPSLIKRLEEGFDLVSGWKKKRRDPISKRLPSKLFNYVTRLISGIKIHDFNCGLKVYRKDVVDSISVYGELHRYIPVLAGWEGFRVGELPVNHRSRKYGRTKFGVSRFFKGFLDLLTVMFLGKYNRRPLHFFGMLGGFLFILGLAIDLYLTIEWFGGKWIGNRPVLFLGILLMIVGIQFISLGLLGEMISAQEVKEDYKVAELVGVDEL